MMNFMKNKAFYAFLAAATLSAFTIPSVYAESAIPQTSIVETETSGDVFLPDKDTASQIDDETLGSVAIHLTDGKEGTSKEKITFECVKVADVVNGEYILLDTYKTLDIDLNAIDTADKLLKTAEKFENMSEHTVAASAITDKDGYAKIEGLEVGVYVILVSGNENYDDIDPTLIAVPTWSETDGMLYDITIEPKHSPRPDVPEKEVPPTNVEDHTLSFVFGAAVCVIIAGTIFVIIRRDGKSHKHK